MRYSMHVPMYVIMSLTWHASASGKAVNSRPTESRADSGGSESEQLEAAPGGASGPTSGHRGTASASGPPLVALVAQAMVYVS